MGNQDKNVESQANPHLRFVLFMLKLFGGFPYTLCKDSTEHRDAESCREQLFKNDHPKIIKKNLASFIWMVLMCVLLVSSSVSYLCLLILGSRMNDTGDTLMAIVQIALALSALCVQPYIFLRNKKLATLANSLTQLTEMKIPLLHRQFLILYAVIASILIVSVHTFYKLVGAYMVEMPKDALRILTIPVHVTHVPLSFILTFGLIYTVSSTLALEIDKRLQELEFFDPEEESNDQTPEEPKYSYNIIGSLFKHLKQYTYDNCSVDIVVKPYMQPARLRPINRRDIQSTVEFILRTDEIVDNLMAYEGFPFMVTFVMILVLLVTLTYRLLQKNFYYKHVARAVIASLMLSSMLCAIDVLQNKVGAVDWVASADDIKEGSPKVRARSHLYHLVFGL